MIKKLLVPTDGSEHARRAIAHASDLASKYDATVFLLHVVPSPVVPHEGVYALPDLQNLQEEDGRRIIEEAEAEAKKRGVKDVRSHMLQGDPASQIIRFAKAQDVDTIVMGNRGLTGIREFLLGSVSHRVSHMADCTVTIVK